MKVCGAILARGYCGWEVIDGPNGMYFSYLSFMAQIWFSIGIYETCLVKDNPRFDFNSLWIKCILIPANWMIALSIMKTFTKSNLCKKLKEICENDLACAHLFFIFNSINFLVYIPEFSVKPIAVSSICKWNWISITSPIITFLRTFCPILASLLFFWAQSNVNA